MLEISTLKESLLRINRNKFTVEAIGIVRGNLKTGIGWKVDNRIGVQAVTCYINIGKFTGVRGDIANCISADFIGGE